MLVAHNGGAMNKFVSVLLWPLVAILGAFAFAALALGRGESVNAVWLVTAALCVYFVAYRFYSKFIADRVLQLDDARPTPAERHNDGTSFRGDRRRWPAGRSGTRGADGLSPRHVMDTRWCCGRRRSAGLHRAVRLGAPRREVARRDHQDRAGTRLLARSLWSVCSPS